MTHRRKCFTFEWKLENASYCIPNFGSTIYSPAFVVDEIESTKWRLELDPLSGFFEDKIAYNLRRQRDSRGSDNVEIEYDLNFIAEDGSNLTDNGHLQGKFPRNASAFDWRFISREHVFVTMDYAFVPNDTLTLRCRIWKSVGEMTEDVKYVGLTSIEVEKRTLKWDVKNFSSLELEKKLNLQVISRQKDLPHMSLDLTLNEGTNAEDVIRVGVSLRDKTTELAILQLFLLNSSGNKVECNKKYFWFDRKLASKHFTFKFTKNKLLEKKDVYLPNDTLSLIWEWGFSKGVVLEEPEKGDHRCVCAEINISHAHNNCDSREVLLNQFFDNVRSLYDDRFLSDVKLKTATSEFPAHKFNLSASSPVFKAMFSGDMKENIKDCVYIEDFDDDTVSAMLLFIYTTRVEDLTWKKACKLYAAADKYDIIILKKICSSFLNKKLSLSNACDVLLFADSHADVELKSYVQDYILKNGSQITQSDEWKNLLNVNPTLAAETVVQLFG